MPKPFDQILGEYGPSEWRSQRLIEAHHEHSVLEARSKQLSEIRMIALILGVPSSILLARQFIVPAFDGAEFAVILMLFLGCMIALHLKIRALELQRFRLTQRIDELRPESSEMSGANK